MGAAPSGQELAGLELSVASCQLPLGWADLPPRQRAPSRAASARAHQAPASWTLGYDAGTQSHLCASQPGDPKLGPRCGVRRRAGPRRAGDRRQRLPRGDLLGGLPEHHRDADGHDAAVPTVLLSGRNPEPRLPETPGSFNEGGELGYSLAHAYGAAFDNPDLLVCCVVGDGEAETGPLATSWHSNKFLDPAQDGAVLPILHLNGYKIANPTVLARIPDEELIALFEGYGHRVHLVAGDVPETVHELLASTLDEVVEEIQQIQREARKQEATVRARWPMIILAYAKGLDRPEDRRRPPGRRDVSRAPGPHRRGA